MTTVYLKDTDPPFCKMAYTDAYHALNDAGAWAKENCNLVSWDVVDVSDVSSAACDWMGEYIFTDEKGAAWFKLKWS